MKMQTKTHPFAIECPAEIGGTADVHKDHWLFKFSNGRGASVVRGEYTYGGPAGKWELAVMGRDGHLDYSTEITDDVIGWLDEDEVTDLLERIARLP